MKSKAIAPPFWRTASFGDSPDTSPMELSALGEHLDRCRGSRGRLFTLRCLADALNSFLASRFVTTLVVVTILFGVIALLT
ncbi:MAG: hypothetical protein HYX43_16120 [Burkholderiales bacterium]|nr:hypothetical protein [Burkholderiales bacterium]